MNKAYFTNIRSQILSLLKKAKEEVDIAMAWFTSSELFASILSCMERGVKVQLVLLDDPINFMEYSPDFNEFIKKGGTLKIANPDEGFMHHKFCIIDGKFVITGSYNWTYYAETRNIENIIITDYPSVVSQYQEEYQRLKDQIPVVSESPRYQWSDIEEMEAVDFPELNYEIEQIANVKHFPQRQIVQTVSSVTITERPLQAVSKYGIGLHVDDGQEILIPQRHPLPFISEPITIYNNDKNIVCAIYKKNGKVEDPLVQENVDDITMGNIGQEIRIRFTLHESGDLIGTIQCIETGKVFDIKKHNPDLIDYVE